MGVRWAVPVAIVVGLSLLMFGFVPAPRAQQWDDMSAKERGEARRNYERFQKMPPDAQRQVERNYNRWQELPPTEKERLRTNYREYQDLSPTERRRFQRDYQNLQGDGGAE